MFSAGADGETGGGDVVVEEVEVHWFAADEAARSDWRRVLGTTACVVLVDTAAGSWYAREWSERRRREEDLT